MIPVFIGYDAAETVAYHVLAHSIINRSSQPVSIAPVGNDVLPRDIWHRPRGLKDSTDFSNARFVIPRLMDYQGWAIFMDCDMLCLGDIAQLWRQRGQRFAVQVRKHVQEVKEGEKKFLGLDQYAYKRKNWSSVMLINCAHPAWKKLDPNTEDGLKMHRFEFLEDDDIGEITGGWNELVTPGKHDQLEAPLWHYTYGGPWHGWVKNEAAWAWCSEFSDMLRGENPRAHILATLAADGVTVGGSYHVSESDARTERDLAKD